MKRLLTITLVLTLILALALPAAAFAKKGGQPGNGKGKAADVAVTGDEAPDAPEAPVKGKGQAKKDKAGVKAATEDLEEDAVEGETEAPDAEDGEESAEPAKLTGIENALSRLQANLARKQAQFEAGLRKNLPSGLQATIAKFMSWLGMEPVEDGEEEDESSSETSPTAEPDDGASEDLPADDQTPADTL